MSAFPLLLSSQAGPPEDPRTWSGTPHRLIGALNETGIVRIAPWSSRLSGATDHLASAADRALALDHPFIWGPARRRLAAWATQRQGHRQGCKAILHLGTYDVAAGPLPNYLYVDNTYDIWERCARAAQTLGPRRRRGFRSLEVRALTAVQRVFTVGRHVAENLTDIYGWPRERVTAVGTGLGGIRPYDGAKDYRNHRLLLVAKVRPLDKGLGLLVDAMRILRRSVPEASLTVVGGAEYPELRGQEGVQGTGWIGLEDLQVLYQEASLFVMPASYEPWGLSYLEALACRTPVVGLARNALPEITDNGRFGFLLAEPSAEALAALLQGALSDPVRLSQMGLEGQQWCLDRYRWDLVATRIAKAIIEDQVGCSHDSVR